MFRLCGTSRKLNFPGCLVDCLGGTIFSVITLATRMATFLGSVSVFDADQGDWTAYIERVEQFFVANGVANEARVPTLIALMGSQTYGLLKSLT